MTSEKSPTKGSLFAVFLTVFIDLLGFGIVLPLLPIYAREFTLDNTGWVIGLLMASFSAMQFVFAPIWGRLSDRVGRRPVLLIGLAGSTISYAVFGLATAMGSLAMMFLSRIGAGIAGATISTAQAYIADSTTKENRTRGMALIGAAFGLGFTFGPLLAAAALVISSPEDIGTSPWPGYTASALSAAAFLFAFLNLPESKTTTAEPAAHRWFDFTSLRKALLIPTIGALLLTSFVNILAMSNFEGVLSFLLHQKPDKGGFGYDIVDVVLVFALLGFMHALSQGLVRGLAKRMTEGRLAITGAVIGFGGFLLLGYATVQLNFTLLITGMLIAGVGFAFIPPAIQSLLSRRSDPSAQGGILGVGQSLGALARIFGHAICIPLFYYGAAVPYWTGAGMMLLAFVLILWSTGRGGDFPNPENS